jgi:hypothetical protein
MKDDVPVSMAHLETPVLGASPKPATKGSIQSQKKSGKSVSTSKAGWNKAKPVLKKAVPKAKKPVPLRPKVASKQVVDLKKTSSVPTVPAIPPASPESPSTTAHVSQLAPASTPALASSPAHVSPPESSTIQSPTSSSSLVLTPAPESSASPSGLSSTPPISSSCNEAATSASIVDSGISAPSISEATNFASHSDSDSADKFLATVEAPEAGQSSDNKIHHNTNKPIAPPAIVKVNGQTGSEPSGTLNQPVTPLTGTQKPIVDPGKAIASPMESFGTLALKIVTIPPPVGTPLLSMETTADPGKPVSDVKTDSPR